EELRAVQDGLRRWPHRHRRGRPRRAPLRQLPRRGPLCLRADGRARRGRRVRLWPLVQQRGPGAGPPLALGGGLLMGGQKATSRGAAYLPQAYDVMSRELCAGQLPDALVTLQRRRNARGYFAAERFADRSQAGVIVDEIAMNPDTFS